MKTTVLQEQADAMEFTRKLKRKKEDISSTIKVYFDAHIPKEIEFVKARIAELDVFFRETLARIPCEPEPELEGGSNDE